MTQPNPQDQAEQEIDKKIVWHDVGTPTTPGSRVDYILQQFRKLKNLRNNRYIDEPEFDEKVIALIESEIAEARKGYVPDDCETCNGTGMEICSNPDHNFIDGVLGFTDFGRIGCPGCGHDEKYRIPNTKCGDCDGTGKAKLYTANELAQAVKEAKINTISENG